MKDFAKAFYKSKAWQRARAAYAASVGGLCEDCLRAGVIKAGETERDLQGAAAERAAAERAAANKWELSDRELVIVASLE